jgi:hypothetical protein
MAKIVLLRSLIMDNTKHLLRSWREGLAVDSTGNPDKEQVFSRVIEKYLQAVEKRGWVVGVEKMMKEEL